MKKMVTRIRRILPRLLLIGGVIAAVLFMLFRTTDVRYHQVSKGTVLVEAFGTGSVESRQMIDVSFEVTGRVVKIYVDQGDRVEKNQELAIIDKQTFQAEVALVEQEVVFAKSMRKRLDADIDRSNAVLKGSEERLNRIKPLVDSGAASAEELDIAEERYKVAFAELTRAQAAQLEGQEAITIAYRRLDRVKVELGRTIVRSPFDGIVLQRVREVGDVAVPGAAVLKLAATKTVWASVWVDETYLDSLGTGLPVRIYLRSDPTRELGGKVVRVSHEVDRETRELLVDVSFDELPEMLVFGQRVDLQIELARRTDVLRVPSRVVIQLDGREGVFVLEDSRAKFRTLKLGMRGRDQIEVVSGLSLGDIVIEPFVGKNKLLKDGERIRLVDDGGEGVSK